MPYMAARTEDVQEVLFLRKFAVPFWALAEVFGRDPMFYYRLQNSLGRFSLAGTTVRRGTLPANLLADEHHQKRDGENKDGPKNAGTFLYRLLRLLGHG